MRIAIAAFVCVLLCGASPVFAQTSSTDTALQFGLKAGLNLSTFGGSDSDEFDGLERKLGWLAGGWVDIPLMPSFSLQPEALLVSKGARTSFEFFGEEIESTTSLTYLEVPILIKWTRNRSEDTSPFAYAGPSVALKLRAVARTSDGQTEETEDVDDLKSTDISLVVGGGMQFGRFSLEGRFTRALTTLHSESDDDDRVDLRNTSLAVLFGVTLGSR